YVLQSESGPIFFEIGASISTPELNDGDRLLLSCGGGEVVDPGQFPWGVTHGLRCSCMDLVIGLSGSPFIESQDGDDDISQVVRNLKSILAGPQYLFTDFRSAQVCPKGSRHCGQLSAQDHGPCCRMNCRNGEAVFGGKRLYGTDVLRVRSMLFFEFRSRKAK